MPMSHRFVGLGPVLELYINISVVAVVAGDAADLLNLYAVNVA